MKRDLEKTRTALLLADAMKPVLEGQYEYVYDRSGRRMKRPKTEIGISAVRGGTIVGEHEVIFAGLDEVIEIKHTAYSKAVFADSLKKSSLFQNHPEKRAVPLL